MAKLVADTLQRRFCVAAPEPSIDRTHSGTGTSEDIILEIGIATDVGRVRDLNEDTAIAEVIAPPHPNPWQISALLMVADGMGGHLGGEVASGLAGTTVTQIFLTNQAQRLSTEDVTGDSLIQRVAESLQYINRLVYKQSLNGGHTGQNLPGTTLTLCLVRPGEYCIGQVGDSRAYLIRAEAAADAVEQLTQDDSLVAEAVREGRLTAEQARTSPFRNHLSKAIGVAPDLEPAVFIGQWAAGDVLLLCSDGLTEHITPAELSYFVHTRDTLQGACESLVDVANDRGGNDNISVVAARFSYPPETPVAAPVIGDPAIETAHPAHFSSDESTGEALVSDGIITASTPAELQAPDNPAPSRIMEPPAAPITAEVPTKPAAGETEDTMPKPSNYSSKSSGRLVGRQNSLSNTLKSPAALAALAGIVVISAAAYGVYSGRKHKDNSSAQSQTKSSVTTTSNLSRSGDTNTTAAPAVDATPQTSDIPSAANTSTGVTNPSATAKDISLWLDPERKVILIACKNSVVEVKSGENGNRAEADPTRPHRALVEFRHWDTAYKQLQSGNRELICRFQEQSGTASDAASSGEPQRSTKDEQGHIKMTIPTRNQPTGEYSLEFAKSGEATGQQLATFRVTTE